ncbi:hypothetical protein FisN_2Hh203 [Fistulifera solaris]|uniref:Uncharacterized protein n=1 Tax=Fistulifera solaris TaxID=1519565 RepID=A0A1Z5KJC9_FISSO|nr:hypothetical protein FisN_2Hh203 [Fistulifera solaris]|eukprot:GAX26379.1 hypothetical protein FisN_2Hh203 [Fistulifera solaris]
MSSRNLARPRSLASSARAKSGDNKQPERPSHSSHIHSSAPKVPQSNTTLLAGRNISIKKAHRDSDTEHYAHDNETSGIPKHPRRLWKVDDDKLPPFPDFFPPPTPRESCLITDAPPSVIAVRIAECLRRRSVAVEYDEDTCTATGVTVDGCSFQIHLWQARDTDVLVECIKQRGSSQTYHWAVQAVLQAAQSLDSGEDRRSVYQASTTEFNRLFFKVEHPIDPSRLIDTESDADTPAEASEMVLASLERAWQLLGKDRCEAQQLGMESIVHLTDRHTTGVARAMYAALAVLGAPATLGYAIPLEDIHERWIYGLIVNRATPTEQGAVDVDSTTLLANSIDDDIHVGKMRSLALRVLANALTILSEYQADVLENLLRDRIPRWTSEQLIDALVADLHGSYRPPTAAPHLSTQHDAALAMQCLGYLSKHSVSTARYIESNPSALSLLDGARTVGRSTHVLLHELSTKIYEQLTEEHRSC